MALGDFTKSRSYAAGPAARLVDALQAGVECGVQVQGVEVTLPTTADVTEKDVFKTDGGGTISFNTGLTRKVTNVYLSELRDGTFRIYDFDVDGVAANDVVDLTGETGIVMEQIRVTILDYCAGPAVVKGRVKIDNLLNREITPIDVFFRKADRTDVPLTVGKEALVGKPLLPSTPTEFTFEVAGDNLWSGSLVIVGSGNEFRYEEVFVNLVYALEPISLFGKAA
jgi:hypothetical protein